MEESKVWVLDGVRSSAERQSLMLRAEEGQQQESSSREVLVLLSHDEVLVCSDEVLVRPSGKALVVS